MQRPRTIIRGCELCRTAHAKCDTQLPACARCVLLKRECVRRLPFPFRHSNTGRDSEFGFADDQVWVEPPSNAVEFVLEYVAGEPSTADESEEQPPTATPDSPESGTAEQSRPLSVLQLLSQTSPVDAYPNAAVQPSPRAGSTPGGRQLTAWRPAQLGESLHAGPGDDGSPRLALSNEHSPLSQCTSRSLRRSLASAITATPGRRHWPLADESEVLLLRHFVAKLSLWFDYCDPQNTFATSVVHHAISSPPLLYAILATSARHLSVTNGHDAYVADRYHRECLELLIPILDDGNAVLDEALFAATVILRLYEEMSVPFEGQDFESHLVGTRTFVRAQGYHHRPSGIRQAAFRVVLRQEIVIAFRTQRPVQLLREYVQVDGSLDQADDWTLAFHIIVLCAEVLTYCYGDEPKTAAAWDDLSDRAQRWMDGKHVTFEPLLYRAQGERCGDQVFPEIWLLNDCHVAAHQHYLICRLLLVAHDPRRPQLGPGRAEAVEAMNGAIRDYARDICGIALSNTHCIPSMFTACLVIGIVGDLFTEYAEQKAMMAMLVKTDVDLAWPTAEVQAYLRKKWGWNL